MTFKKLITKVKKKKCVLFIFYWLLILTVITTNPNTMIIYKKYNILI